MLVCSPVSRSFFSKQKSTLICHKVKRLEAVTAYTPTTKHGCGGRKFNPKSFSACNYSLDLPRSAVHSMLPDIFTSSNLANTCWSLQQKIPQYSHLHVCVNCVTHHKVPQSNTSFTCVCPLCFTYMAAMQST